MFMWDCDSSPPPLSLSLSHGLSKILPSTPKYCTLLLSTYIHCIEENLNKYSYAWGRERGGRERGERERGRKNGGSLELSITCGIRDMCRALDTSCNQAGRIIFTSFPWCEEWDLSEMITLIPRRPAGRGAWSGSGSTFPRHCCVNDHCTTDRIMMCL